MEGGALDHRATFQSPVQERDEDGQIVQGWRDEFTGWANVRYLRGGESVMQARLASRNPVIVTIRNSERARQITSEWQVELRDRTGIRKTYQIKEDPRPSEASGFLEMLAEG